MSNVKSVAFAAMLLGATQVNGGSFTFVPENPVTVIPDKGPVYPTNLRTPNMCVLYHFGLHKDDPLWIGRTGALAVDLENTIYGAGPQGGAHNRGVIFAVSSDGKLRHVYDFNFTDGVDPEGGVTMGRDGSLYGSTYGGGDGKGGQNKCPFPEGTLYSVTVDGGYNKIWDFRNGWLRPLKNKDDHWTPQEILDSKGSYPVSPPVQTKDGQWYGVTSYSNNQQYGVFYTIGFRALQVFDGKTANFPVSLSPGVTDNNVYGVTWGGAKSNPWGTVIQGGAGGFHVIHTFHWTDGGKPLYVIQGEDGRLYGTTMGGQGDLQSGSIYAMTPSGTDYKIIHKFDINNGANPASGVVWGSDGRLYGTTQYGGKHGRGVFYRVNPDGKDFTVLHHFTFGQTGRRPIGRIIEGYDHNFYGTTYEGGWFDAGVLFKLDAGLATPKDPELFSERWCCSLGQGAGNGTKVLDPLEVKGHHYGGGDPVGFVYTTHIGLVDIGHVRDNADLTKYIYDYLMDLPRSGKYAPISLFAGDLQVHKLPDDQDEILDMAGAIAYLEGWAHELTTYGTTSQDFSAFSPEDLVSNAMGIQVGKNAIRHCCEVKYDEAMDVELLKMLNDLGVMSAFETQRRINSVYGLPGTSHAGKWFTETLVFETLWRRNFIPYPWLIPYSSVGAYRPGWLTTEYFKKYWDGTWFDYKIRDAVDGQAGVTLKDMQKMTDSIHGKWVRDNPGMDRWP